MKNNKRTLFMDLDGTLLNSKGKMSEYSLRVLQKASQEGFRVIITSARSKLLKGIQENHISSFCSTMILHNGAEIWDAGVKIYSDYLLPCEIREIAALLHDGNEMIASICDDKYYTNYDARSYWGDIRNISHIDFRTIDISLPKLMIYNPQRRKIRNLDRISMKYCVTVTDENTAITISRKTATKGNAISYLQHLYGIPYEECIAFGNDTNDVSAFKNCGQGIAVGNACNDIIAVSSLVIGINDEDSVAKYVEDLVKECDVERK